MQHLPYEEDCIRRYENLHQLDGFVLLESINKSQGRYDVLTAFPYETHTHEASLQGAANFIDFIQSRLPHIDSESPLPFIGGAVCCFSYDFGEMLHDIPTDQRSLLTNTPSAQVNFYDWAIVVDHWQKDIVLVSLNQFPETTGILDEVLTRWHSNASPPLIARLLSPFTAQISRKDYVAALDEIFRYLREGRTYQVNFTQPFSADYSGNPFALYKKIRQKNPVPFAAYLQMKEQSLLSFSPERFLQGINGRLLASPIKGSMQRSEIKQMDEQLAERLRTCAKNRAENTMIVDMLRNDLSQFCIPGSVEVNGLCDVRSFEQVHHLVSDVMGQMKAGCNNLSAFRDCFPGASITGAPKRESMRVIAELEHYKRGIYCGSLGYFSAHGRFDTNIAIRTIIADNGRLLLGTGGGIVIDSKAEAEYEECLTKIAAINSGLAQ